MAFDAVTLGDYSGEELFGRFCAMLPRRTRKRRDGPVARSLNTAVPDLTRIRARYWRIPRDAGFATRSTVAVSTCARMARERCRSGGMSFGSMRVATSPRRRWRADAINKLVDYLRSLRRD